MRALLALSILAACLGCGEDQTVKVTADPSGNQSGPYSDSIQKAQDVADKANNRVMSNERTLSENR